MKKLYLFFLLIFNITTGQTIVQDPTFNSGTGITTWSGFGTVTVRNVLQQPDGKIIVVGQFLNYNGIVANCIIRLNSDGTKDNSFNAGSGTNAGIWGCTLQSDGKIIIFGGFTSYNGVSANRIARLNTNGTKDLTFAIGTGPNDYLESVSVQSDGKIIIGGSFTSYNGAPINRVARLNVNGTLDTSFNIGTGADARVREVAIQADGKIFVAGDFFTFNNIAIKKLIRLNSNGAIDNTYNTGGTGPLSNVWTMALQSDGKLIIGGEFQAYNGTGRNRIARINVDGTLDTTFIIGTGANSNVMAIFPDTDGKIYIGGSFATYNGVARGQFARLNSDGSLDTGFTIGSGFDDWVMSITKQQDNKLLIGGTFLTYNGFTTNRILRTTAVGLSVEAVSKINISVHPNPSSSMLHIDATDHNLKYQITDVSGKITATAPLTDTMINVEDLAEGVYLLTLFSDKGETTTVRFVKN